MVLVTVTVVVLRNAFNTGSIVLQETVIYLHALVFMLGIPYTLKHDGHVRVDVLRARFSPATRLKIEIAGHVLLLLPVSIAVLVLSLPYVAASWRVLEGSSEAGGIPAVFLLKTLIPLSATLLALQGAAELTRSVIALHGLGRDPS